MARRFLRFAVPALLAVAVAALVVAERAPLLGAAIETYLAARGFPGSRAEVVEFTPARIVLAPLALGRGGPAAARVEIGAPFGPDFTVAVAGLRASVNLGEARGGEFPSPLSVLAGETAPFGLAREYWPKLVVSDARLVLRGLSGGDIALSGGGTLDIRRPGIEADINGTVSAAHTDASFRLESAASSGAPQLRLALTGESDLARVPWPAAPRPESGRASYDLQATVPASLLAGPKPEGTATARLDLHLKSVAVPSRVRDLSGDLALDAQVTPGEARVSLRGPARLAAASLSVPELAGAFAPLAARLEKGATVTLAAVDPQTPVLVATAQPDGWRDDVNASLTLAFADGEVAVRLDHARLRGPTLLPRELESAAVAAQGRGLPLVPVGIDSFAWHGSAGAAGGRINLSGPLELATGRLDAVGLMGGKAAYKGKVSLDAMGSNLVLEAAGPGTLSITGAPRFGALTFHPPVTARVTSARIEKNAEGTTLAAALDPAAVTGALAREGAEALAFRADAGEIALDAALAKVVTGDVRIKDGSLALLGWQLTASAIEAAIPLAPGGAEGKVSAILSSQASPVLFAPVTATLDVARREGAIEATGKIALAEGRAEAPLTAHYDADRGRGALAIGPARIAFAPGALQPGDLAPALASLTKAGGAVRGEAAFDYDAASGMTGRGQIAFESVSLDTPQARVEGLAGTVVFADLLHLRSAPQQSLSATRIVAAGAPLDDVTVHFAVAPGQNGPEIAIAEAKGSVAGGGLAVRDATLDLGAPANALAVSVQSVSLSRLLENLGTQNVSGTGSLSGSIPIRFGAAGLVIENGEIRAHGKGVLHVGLGSAKETLEKQGQAASLMVRALEDFHYDRLEIGIDRPPGGELALAVTLEGMNPAVLEGHPFRFNIHLTGDLPQLLAALRAGRGLTTDVLERALEVNP